MAYPLFLTVRPVPVAEDVPDLRERLEEAFPLTENLTYLDGLCRSSLPRVTAERLGALSLLPSLLAAAEIPIEGLLLRRDCHGRPHCVTADGSPASFDFNLSHSAGHIACALAIGGGLVGVDVEEHIPSSRALPLIRRYCTPGEMDMLKRLPSDEDHAARFFTSVWVEREAMAKQEGGGMPLRFDTAELPTGIVLWSGVLPRSQAGIALCAPLLNAPRAPRLLPDSLPVDFKAPLQIRRAKSRRDIFRDI
jgi:hypothetical protein